MQVLAKYLRTNKNARPVLVTPDALKEIGSMEIIAPKSRAGKTAAFTPLANTLWTSGQAAALGPIATAVYAYLRFRAGRSGVCWPSVARIAQEVGTSVSSVKRAIPRLVEAGLLSVEARLVPGRVERDSNLYRLASALVPSQNEPTSGQSGGGGGGEVGPEGASNNTPFASNKKADNNTGAAAAFSPPTLGAPTPTPEQALVDSLVAVGVAPAVAARLVQVHGAELCLRELEALPTRAARNPAAVLVASIVEAWETPARHSPAPAGEATTTTAAPRPASTPEQAQEREQRRQAKRAQAARVAFEHLDARNRQAVQDGVAKFGMDFVVEVERLAPREFFRALGTEGARI